MRTLFKKYTINDLNSPSIKSRRIDRNSYRIVIIDDESFENDDRLRRVGFNVSVFSDIEDIRFLSEYDIVICDIKGVGKKLSEETGGALLLNEAKKTYPYKMYAAYSGSYQNIIVNEYLDGVKIIKKDYALEDWIAALDSLLKEYSDPATVWIKIRDRLLSQNVSIHSVAKLEHEYVNTILNKGADFKGFYKKSESSFNLDPETVKIIQIIISGGLKFLISTM